MQRSLPLIIALLVTIAAAGSAVGVNAVTRTLASPSEEDLALLEDGAPGLASGGSAGGDRAADRRAAGRARVKSEKEYLNTIMGRNIFDPELISQWNPAAASGGGGTQAVTDLKVRLVSTVVATPEKYSAAFIAEEDDDDGFAKGYNIGHKLHDAEIVKIEDLKVTLRRGDGSVEVLTASEEKPTTGRSRPSSSSGGSGDGQVEQIGDNKFAVDRALIDEYIGDIEGISKMGRALLHRGPDGEFDGYRLSAIRRNTLADQLGIKNGDVVHSVNGQPLNSVQNAMGAYQQLMSEDTFTFEVTRRGQKVTMEYEVR